MRLRHLTFTAVAALWAIHLMPRCSDALPAPQGPLPVVGAGSLDAAFQPIPSPPALTPVVILGRDLFSEKKLSGSGQISCASCHDLSNGGADHKSFSEGHNGKRGIANSPSVFNSALNFRQFWDGRVGSLADHIEGPINSPRDMASNWPELTARLNADPAYAKRFRAIFGTGATRENVKEAIVSFENTLLTENAPFDKFLRGDVNALTPSQKKGYHDFRKLGCVSCHQGVNVGGNMFQTMGLMGDYFRDRGGSFESDQGRFRLTHDPEDLHLFRVPSLRNVASTGPYFHDGHAKTLEEAVTTMAKYQLGERITPRQASDISNFLRSLSGELPASLRMEKGKQP